ncbi:MAG: hypothetical protein ACNA8G_11530 [Gammaproteobacteria bacterium]
MKPIIVLAAALGSLAWTASAVAEDRPAPREPGGNGLEITMRIIEDPGAVRPEGISRRIMLPVAPAGEGDAAAGPPAEQANGAALNATARGQGREFGAEVSEQARELADQASELRDEFGRSRAEEMRPDPPERPEIERPEPPQR